MQRYRRLEKLEALRGAAAFYVFAHHLVHLSPELASLKRFFVFGQLAVLVFFVLSGFVIYYATVARNPDMPFRTYFIRRFRRIYFPFVVVLLISWLLQSWAVGDWWDPTWKDLAGNLLQLQDKNAAGSWFEPYMANSPLWSLSYEWWFYMMFFAIYKGMRAYAPQQKYVVGAMAVIGFGTFWLWPNQISLFVGYFILWWSGLEMAREFLEKGTVTFKGQLPTLLLVALGTMLWAIPAYLHYRNGGAVNISVHPFVEFRHFASVFVVLLLGIAWYRVGFKGFDLIFGIFTRLAPISYALYIVHLPIIRFATRTRPTGSLWLDLLWIIPVTFGISWLIERKLQIYVNKWLK
ncbi:MAG: acyltransferase [Bacteroidota bacterium]